MSTLTQSRPTAKVSRFVRLVKPLDAAGANAEISITVQRGRKTEVSSYWLDCLPCDLDGRAFLLEKQGDGTEPNEEYHVRLENEQDHSCTCPGHSFKGKCKHVDSVRKLLAVGKLQ